MQRKHYTMVWMLVIVFTLVAGDLMAQRGRYYRGPYRSYYPRFVPARPFISSRPFVYIHFGGMAYERPNGQLYEGSWDISRETIPGGCYTDDVGNYVCDNRRVKTLYLSGIDFASQDYFSIRFDEMVFTGTNRFKAYIYEGWKTYIFRFRR